MTERKPDSVVDISMDRSTDADERPVHNQSPAPARRSESHARAFPDAQASCLTP